VIRATNVDYPRPDLSKPGYVGAGCLSKDPYIIIDSAEGYQRSWWAGSAS
jgi:UDP-N-acetyl-D-mannosaminuronic acid dehydrogenase